MTDGRDETRGAPFVIIWTPVGRDASLASNVLNRAGIRSRPCMSLQDVCAAVGSEDTGLLIVSEEALNSESIQQLRETLEQQAPWSDLSIILLTGGGTSTEASLYRLGKMRALGNITLLERPLRRVTLIAAVHSGLASRRRQFQTRDHIRELQEAQQELAQANADLKQFAFAASHDLQEPLRMINAFTQLLLDRHIDRGDIKAQEFATYIRTGVTRMEALLRDLLLYSRAIHEERDAPGTHADLACAISDAARALKVEIDATGARIISASMPVVRGDQTQLSLVFQNLISNSIKYGKDEVAPLIEISVERIDAGHIVRVRDNGIGFDPKYAERVFDLFQRLEEANVPGTGLGLALCRRIIERHGGRMWAESQPGKGSTFLFTIPAE